MDKTKIYRFLDIVMIVNNGVKLVITDKNITSKTDDEILALYSRKCGEKDG